jgi:hypothetical protein
LENFLCSFNNLTCAFLAIITIAAWHKPFVARAAVSALADGVMRLWILVDSFLPICYFQKCMQSQLDFCLIILDP